MTPIPHSTAQNLLNPAPPGERHNQMVKLALQLLRWGLVPEAVEAQFRATYDEDVTDEEIANIVTWAEENADQPPRPRSTAVTTPRRASATRSRMLGTFAVAAET